jgi:hypothetical protein
MEFLCALIYLAKWTHEVPYAIATEFVESLTS